LAALSRPAANWDIVDQMRKGINVPVLIKGIMTPEEAEAAVKRGVQGIVVSNYGGLLTPGMASSMEMLPSIADAVAGKVPVLIPELHLVRAGLCQTERPVAIPVSPYGSRTDRFGRWRRS
jgi:hypothetical protein